MAHPEQEPEDKPTPLLSENIPSLPEPKRVVTLSLAKEATVGDRKRIRDMLSMDLSDPPER